MRIHLTAPWSDATHKVEVTLDHSDILHLWAGPDGNTWVYARCRRLALFPVTETVAEIDALIKQGEESER
jgi:hypothetical protein